MARSREWAKTHKLKIHGPYLPDDMKQCVRCRKILPLDDFWVENGSPKGRNSRCKPCGTAGRRKRAYGITPDRWEARLEAQNYGCWVCGAEESPGGKALSADHDHVTGEFRGILCSPCNTSLGLLQESPERILGLHLYIKLHASSSLIRQVN